MSTLSLAVMNFVQAVAKWFSSQKWQATLRLKSCLFLFWVKLLRDVLLLVWNVAVGMWDALTGCISPSRMTLISLSIALRRSCSFHRPPAWSRAMACHTAVGSFSLTIGTRRSPYVSSLWPRDSRPLMLVSNLSENVCRQVASLLGLGNCMRLCISASAILSCWPNRFCRSSTAFM